MTVPMEMPIDTWWQTILDTSHLHDENAEEWSQLFPILAYKQRVNLSLTEIQMPP